MHWTDGRTERPEEDYGPEWYVVEELLGGHFVIADPQSGQDISYGATPVIGAERDRLWARFDPGSAAG